MTTATARLIPCLLFAICLVANQAHCEEGKTLDLLGNEVEGRYDRLYFHPNVTDPMKDWLSGEGFVDESKVFEFDLDITGDGENDKFFCNDLSIRQVRSHVFYLYGKTALGYTRYEKGAFTLEPSRCFYLVKYPDTEYPAVLTVDFQRRDTYYYAIHRTDKHTIQQEDIGKAKYEELVRSAVKIEPKVYTMKDLAKDHRMRIYEDERFLWSSSPQPRCRIVGPEDLRNAAAATTGTHWVIFPPIPTPVLKQSGTGATSATVVTTRASSTSVTTGTKPGGEVLLADFQEDLGNEINLEMVAIQSGAVLIGSPKSESGRSGNEGPQTEVALDSYWMGQYEVTQEQYERLMSTNPANFKGAKNPVENVSWDDAMGFCRKLSEKTGKQYTLPTEGQWEFACRAGTTTPYSFGQTMTTDQANFFGATGSVSGEGKVLGERTIKVGTFPPNAFGLYDMHGDVSEWCLSQIQAYPYREDDGRNDLTVSAPRVLRGGSWIDTPMYCRSASRSYIDPVSANSTAGFRVVCLPLPKAK